MELFDDAFVRDFIRRHGGRPPHEQPPLLSLLTNADRKAQRAWMNEGFDGLSADAQAKLSTRLRSSKRHETAVFELAVAHVLLGAGADIEYDRPFGHLTPDLFVAGSAARSPVLIEVTVRQPRQEESGERGAWHALRTRISDIPVAVALLVSDSDPTRRAEPPEGKAARALNLGIRRWLLNAHRPVGSSTTLLGYRIQILRDTDRLSAHLEDPTYGSSSDSDALIRTIAGKASRYAATAESIDAALVVLVGGGPTAPISPGMLRDTLNGRNVTTLSFSPFASGLIGDQTVSFQRDDSQPRFDPTLSAVGWIDLSEMTPRLDLFPLKTARQAATLPLTPRIAWHSLSSGA